MDGNSHQSFQIMGCGWWAVGIQDFWPTAQWKKNGKPPQIMFDC